MICPGKNGRECGQYVLVPEGAPFLFGHDHDGNEVWMRVWSCGAGHWFTLEHTEDTYEEVISSGDHVPRHG